MPVVSDSYERRRVLVHSAFAEASVLLLLLSLHEQSIQCNHFVDALGVPSILASGLGLPRLVE